MKRTNWILLSILTYLITLIYVLINRPLYSKEENLLKAIPHFYWILLALNSVLLTWLIFDYSKRNKLIATLLSLMYGFLFYITNLYFIIPYEQSDIWPSTAIEYMLTSGRITHEALSNPSLSYLSYPISFILETAIMVVGDVNKIGIYTIGLFTFMGISYVGLLFYYHKIGKDMRFAVLSLATYIILSFYVINDQVAPQTLALALIPYLYRLTFDYMERKGSLRSLTIITILYFALVFTHPFMFLFYVLPILGVILYYRTSSRSSQIKGTIIWVFLSVWGFGFIYLFYNLLSIPLRVFIERFGEYEGETWWVFTNFLRRPGEFGPIKYTPHPHYDLISRAVVEVQALALRVLLIFLLIIATYGFIHEIRKNFRVRRFAHQLVFDISILFSSGLLFVVGLITSFLGQRVFQVVFIPFSRYILSEGSKRYIKITLMIILMISPVLYTVNTLINETVSSPLFTRDPQTVKAGLFLDYSLSREDKYVFTGTNELFPVNAIRYSAINWIRAGKFSVSRFDYIFWSRKVELTVEYYGAENIFLNELKNRGIIYNNKLVEVCGR